MLRLVVSGRRKDGFGTGPPPALSKIPSNTLVAEKSFTVIIYLIVPDFSKGLRVYLCLRAYPEFAGVAQSVEHLICNQGVGGSNPFASSSKLVEAGGIR